MYGVFERQFRRYFAMAERRKELPARSCCSFSSGGSITWSTGWASPPRGRKGGSWFAMGISRERAERWTSPPICSSPVMRSTCGIAAKRDADSRGVGAGGTPRRPRVAGGGSGRVLRPGEDAANRADLTIRSRKADRRAVLQVTVEGYECNPQRIYGRDLHQPPKGLEAEEKNLTPSYAKVRRGTVERGTDHDRECPAPRAPVVAPRSRHRGGPRQGVLHEFATLPGVERT